MNASYTDETVAVFWWRFYFIEVEKIVNSALISVKWDSPHRVVKWICF